MPETSVIIPTYNRLPYLKEAVESVMAQTYPDFELIVVDDGSSDGTAAYAQKLSFVNFLRQTNHGPSAARNKGIRAAKGGMVTFLDSDDLWHKNKLKTQVDWMNTHPDCMVCYTDEVWIRNGRRVNPRNKHRKYSGWIFEYCVPLCIVSPSSVLMRREFFDRVGLFDPELPACEDYDLWLRASLQFPFEFIAQRLITKRGGHPDQLSAQWGLDVYRVKVLQKILTSPLITPPQEGLVRKELVAKSRILEAGFRKRGKEQEALYYKQIADTLVDDDLA